MFPFVIISFIAATFLFAFWLGRVIKNLRSEEKMKFKNLRGEENKKAPILKRNTTKKSPRRLLGVSVTLFVLSIGLLVFFMIPSCSSTLRSPVVVLLKDGNKFVYHGNPYLIEKAIENGEAVETEFYSTVDVYPIDGALYISPSEVQAFAALFGQQYRIIMYEQPAHQGFFVETDDSRYVYTTSVIPTDRIGVTEREHVIELSNADSSVNRTIRWRQGDETIPIENCEIKSIWVVSNPYPGKTVGNWRSQVLVNLSELVAYFDSNASIELNEDQNILVLSGF
jgi:hypothetical protein